jgi:ligand-binding SRPBCC domain-containing protein
VFVFLSDPKNLEKILADSEFKIEDVSNQPAGVGTRFLLSAVVGGLKVKPHWHEIVEFEENSKIVNGEVKGGPMKKEEFSFVFKTTDGGTSLTVIIDYVFPYSVFGKILDKLLARKAFDRLVMNGAKKAKELLEAA